MKPSFKQFCIEPECGSTYALTEPLYVCPVCGGLLDITWTAAPFQDAAAVRKLWRDRMSSFKAADRSGVWRFRELLPFDPDAPVVTLSEGNTPLYDAPKSASYCQLDSLKLKHQGMNPTGSFKDTGMTVAVT